MNNKHLFTILTASFLFGILTFSCTKFEEGPGRTFRLRSVKHRLCDDGWNLRGRRIYADQSKKQSDISYPTNECIFTFDVHFSKDGTYLSQVIILKDEPSYWQGTQIGPTPTPYPGFYKYNQFQEGQWWFDKKDKTILYMTFDGVTEKMKITSLSKNNFNMFHIDDSTGIIETFEFLSNSIQ